MLLVDDDPDVRDVLTAQLGELGCAVVPVTSGHAALDLLDADEAEGFDLLISDYAMPASAAPSWPPPCASGGQICRCC